MLRLLVLICRFVVLLRIEYWLLGLRIVGVVESRICSVELMEGILFLLMVKI